VDISFTPSPDVSVLLNVLLDQLERRVRQNTEHTPRSIKVLLPNIPLPEYFSQTDPVPRLTANEQLQQLEQVGMLHLSWLPGEAGHLLGAVTLQMEQAPRLFALLQRPPLSNQRVRLETLLMADHFRFSPNDWRACAIRRILERLRAGKSPSPFSLTDTGLNLDLLTALLALSDLQRETSCRVFSVQTFNNSKRFEDLKPAILRLARLTNPEWKKLPDDDLLRELNLVANPGYILLSGNWELTAADGQVLSLAGFIPSVGFPASQAASIQRVTPRAPYVLCIENLTSFLECANTQTQPETCNTRPAIICLMGNPSPAIRYLLRLIPEAIPIHLWADMDYGGFNILSQLRRQVGQRIQPWLMDVATFGLHTILSRPLTRIDACNLKRLTARPELFDIRPTIEYLLERGLKLEQEAIRYPIKT
jgi:hypothetical protein